MTTLALRQQVLLANGVCLEHHDDDSVDVYHQDEEERKLTIEGEDVLWALEFFENASHLSLNPIRQAFEYEFSMLEDKRRSALEDSDLKFLHAKIAELEKEKAISEQNLANRYASEEEQEAEARAEQLKSDVKANAKKAIREIVLKCRWLISGLYIGSFGISVIIAKWLESTSHGDVFAEDILAIAFPAAVLLPLPLIMILLWLENRLTSKYAYRVAMGEYENN